MIVSWPIPRSATGSSPSPEVEERVDHPRLWKVLLHNDDYTTQEFVVWVLESIFHLPHAEAFAIMMHVHQAGVGVAGLFTRDVAETKVKATAAAGRTARIPVARHHRAGFRRTTRMSRTPVPFAPDTLESIRRAFRVASDRRHDLVSLEHMLHALVEDPQAREILTRCRVNLANLRTDLEEVLDRAFTPVPGKKSVKPESTLGFDRVVERAVVHAASSSAQQVESGALARVPAPGRGEPRRVLPAQAGRRSVDAAARDRARRAGPGGAGPRAGWRRRRESALPPIRSRRLPTT